MDCNNTVKDLERLEEQIFYYKPSLKSTDQRQNVSNCLRNQLIDSKAVVRIQRMDAECENLMISLKQRLMLLQDILMPKAKERQLSRHENELKDNEEVLKLNLSSDSSDDETLSSIKAKQRQADLQRIGIAKKGKMKSIEAQLADTSEPNDSYLPLALRRKPRERKLSYKSFSSSASTSHSHNKRTTKLQNKQEHTVTTSGVAFHSDEMLLEQEEVDTTPTLHIKIPSLHRGNVHYIILDSLNFARKVFDYRANEIKQQQQQKASITHTTSKSTKSRKKQVKSLPSTVVEQLTHQDQELELSQLIQDVMAEACNDETLQATNALENINNNIIDNYDPIGNDNFINYSQSSQELTFSQNSNIIVDTVCSTSGANSSHKKPRKNSKRTNEQQQQLHDEPPKKRGRKPKKKNASDDLQLQPQPPTKSNLAKYVEFFANDCELLPGSTTPAASSTRSQPLVSSTTHNFEVIDQLAPQQQQHEQQNSQQQQPITYYIDGDWANGGPCQLVATNGMSVDTRQLNQEDMNAPFQDFVNYIDNSSDSGNNVIARVLENNNSLPISIPLPIANRGLQNKNQSQAPPTRPIQQTIQASYVPVINIQIPSLPNNITSPTAPPPAHTHKDVLDLSVKSKPNTNIITSEVLNLNQISNNLENSCLVEEDDCVPLDLSAKSTNAKKQITDNNHVTIDKQDEDFIRRLIEQNDFEYSADAMKKGAEDAPALSYDSSKSFKAALDMPLLDFDATDLAQLVENTTTASSKEAENLTDKIVYNNSPNNEDSNYVTMSAVNSSIETNLHFTDQSTTEIFNKLLDICPDNQFLDNISSEFISNDNLNESVFDHCRVENSTMYESVNQKQNSICDTTSQKDNQDTDNSTSIDEPSSSTSTSLAVQIDSSNKTSSIDLNISMSSDMSVNFKFCDNNDQQEFKDAKVDKSENLNKSENEKVCIDPKTTTTIDEHKEVQLQDTEKTLENNNKNEKCLNNSLNNNNINKDKTKHLVNKKANSENCEKSVADEISNNIEKVINNKSLQKSQENITKVESAPENVDDKCLSKTCEIKIDEKISIDVANTKKVANKCTKDVNHNNKSMLDTSHHQTISKPKENIVFSVAKITLTEDDILYSTDSSDTASGKSCDVNEAKPMDIDNEIKESQDLNNKKENTIHENEKKDTTTKKLNQEKESNNTKSKEAVCIDNATINSSSYCNEIVNLSLSVENDNKTSSAERDAVMKDLTIANIKNTIIDKEPKYTDNDNEHSNDSVISCYYNDDFNLLANEMKTNQSSFNDVMNLSVSSLKNTNESSEEVILNIHNTDDEDDVLLNAENNTNLENNAKKDKSQNKEDKIVELDINQENLTLLELESKLEDSLDFDEDFDDALSLATSCFDSPNEDRFGDSIVDVDDTTITSVPKTAAQEVAQNTEKTNTTSATKDLKHFKIPKLNITTTTKTQDFENEPTQTKQNTTITTNTVPKIQLLTNMEKLTRTVKNDLIQSQENPKDINLTTNSEHVTTTSAIVEIISKVFGITCLPYLIDKCFAITHCQLSHQFNDSDTVYQYLNTLDKFTVNLAYRVLYNHSKLFIIYFKVFCAYYTTKNDRSKLLNMLNDCERYPEYAEYMMDIYESLVKCGFSRVNACRQILKRIRELTSDTTIIDVLIAIIMKSDWTMFTDFIEKYTQEMYKYNYRIGILEQMAPAVLNSKGPHLKQVFGKCVQTLHCDETGLLLNSPSLIQCVALLTTTAATTSIT
ncbi:metacaspase-2-like [Lucilia cuprina]|uniref:metacaspase-2-like n=1 Tax=Lucilia cuprina TaxID=7375 RepID=UPI001F068885|nr:metacaspase-2-like [Lucilia cuprina]